jgi:VanZ family protein
LLPQGAQPKVKLTPIPIHYGAGQPQASNWKPIQQFRNLRYRAVRECTFLLAGPRPSVVSFPVAKVRAALKYWLPVLVWMGLIFTASGDAGSAQHSSRLLGPLVLWLFPHATPEALYVVSCVVRKGAHVTEYAILALLVWRALRRPAWPDPRPWHWPDALRTLLVVVLYAASDEFHQSFVPSREATVRDVLIDTAGGSLALLLLWALHSWQSRRQHHPSRQPAQGRPTS